MPDPSSYASEDAFMEACVPMMMDEGHDQDQAVAACASMWRDKTLQADGERGTRGNVGERGTRGHVWRDKAIPVEELAAKSVEPIIGHRDKVSSVDRAWSVLTVKSVDAERREIEGIASTPTVDRIGDVVEPMGAKFTLPMPLLHHHDHRSPVGHVVAAKATKDGITIKAKLARETEPGPLKDRLDTAWQELKSGLVRGLSIGFKPLEYEALEKGGIRFLSWAWHELSLVTIPAQQDAQISLIKSLDADLLAASGNGQDGIGNGAAAKSAAPSRPGGSGKSSINLKPMRRSMSKTVTEQIAALEARRAANEARMAEIMQKAVDEGRSTDEAEREDFDNLESEVDTLDGDLKRFRKLEKQMQATAKPVEQVKSAADASTMRNGHFRVTSPKLEPGIRFARLAKCIGIARGDLSGAMHVAEQRYSDDQGIANVLRAGIQHGSVTKAAVEAGSTTSWAGFLVGDETSVFSDFAEFLRPMTVVGRFGTNGYPALTRVPFRTALLTQTGGGDGYWVGEGAGKGLTSFAGSRTTLTPLKAANIAVLTDEVVRDSSPSAEILVRDQLAKALAARIDTDFLDPANSGTASIKPASITNGATTTASSGVTAAAVRADLSALLTPFIDNDNPISSIVLLMSVSTALNLSLLHNDLGQPEFPSMSVNGGTLAGIPVMTSEFVGTSGGSPNTRYVWAVSASDIWFADEGDVSVDMSREASIQMDSAPTNASVEVGSPNQGVPTTLVSLWQTNSVGFRAERTLNWALRRSYAVQGLSGVVWGT